MQARKVWEDEKTSDCRKDRWKGRKEDKKQGKSR